MDDDYDIVVDVLQREHDKLLKMTQQNIEHDMFNIMDQIRLEHCDTLNKAIRLWKEHHDQE